MTEVTQSDRDAAAGVCVAPEMAEVLRSGRMDGHTYVRAFARHRLAHVTPNTDLSDERAIEVLRSVGKMEAELRSMDTAPRDRSSILARYNPEDDHLEARFKGRWFVIFHEGVTEDGYDMGWALYPGYGGVSARHFDGWLPLPNAALNTLSGEG